MPCPSCPLCSRAPKTRHFTSYKQATDHALLTFGATDLAVYEALAQTRFTHFGYLVWHLPSASAAQARLTEITAQCGQHGVGLIRIHDPGNYDTFETILDPVRKSTPHAAVDSFLERRLAEREQKLLRDALEGTLP